jgi:GT2 family glycosyltransferase
MKTKWRDLRRFQKPALKAFFILLVVYVVFDFLSAADHNPNHKMNDKCIAVTVFNSVENVETLWKDLLNTLQTATVVFVNDKSTDPGVAPFLDRLGQLGGKFQVFVIHLPARKGFSASANVGMQFLRREQQCEVVALLNSDLRLFSGWYEGLLSALFSAPDIAMSGPLTNAGSYQSVPDVWDGSKFSFNKLHDHQKRSGLSNFVSKGSQDFFPRIPLLNGFCMMIRLDILENVVGYFDEKDFPHFGQETDLQMRIRLGGYGLALADNVYIYHEKGISYKSERKTLNHGVQASLKRKYGKSLDEAVEEMSKSKKLALIREGVRQSLEYLKNACNHPVFKVVFVMSSFAPGGGVHSVISESYAANSLFCGLKVLVAFPSSSRKNFLEHHNDPKVRDMAVFYDTVQDIEKHAIDANVVVATYFTTLKSSMLSLLAII